MFCFREIIMQQKMLLLPYSGIGISLKKRLLVGLYFKTDCDSVSYFFCQPTQSRLFTPSSVCLLVCQQDNTTTTERISMELGWRMSLGTE